MGVARGLGPPAVPGEKRGWMEFNTTAAFINRRLRRVRAGLAVGAVLALGLGGTPVSAQGARPSALAYDGGQLARESWTTRASFATVWGDRAATRWIEEHNAELAAGRPLT